MGNIEDTVLCPNCGGMVQPNKDGLVENVVVSVNDGTGEEAIEDIQVTGHIGVCTGCKAAVDMLDPTGEDWESAPEEEEDEMPRLEDLPEDVTAEELVDAYSREELDHLAGEGASSMANKTEVAEAIVASREEGGEDGEAEEAEAPA